MTISSFSDRLRYFYFRLSLIVAIRDETVFYLVEIAVVDDPRFSVRIILCYLS